MSIDFEIVSPAEVGMCANQLDRISQHLNEQYIAKTKISGCSTLIARKGKVCYFEHEGLRDLERNTEVSHDTMFRIYSMSKPITSVAMMQLYERGKFALTDPVHRFIPEWKNLQVYKAGFFPVFQTIPCLNAMTVRDLLMHTSGLTYDFLRAGNVDSAYRRLKLGRFEEGYTLKDMIQELAALPLAYQPGESWNYSFSTDVLGYLIEQMSGMNLDDYLRENIFEPLEMHDTAFNIVPEKESRLASCYNRNVKKTLALQDDGQDSAYKNRTFFSGGGGLISTMSDYYQFCNMLLNGGKLNGKRILGPRTLAYMHKNHLPGGKDMSNFATGTFSETAYEGMGFGLGFATKIDHAQSANLGSEGEYFWGGAASTIFWIDPKEELVVIFMTQFMPSSTFNFRGQLQSLIYPALLD